MKTYEHYWKILENTESQWMCGASWPAAPWVGALMEGCSTSWLSTGYRVIWIDWAILGISWPFLATIGQSMPLYICHYMPLIFIHWISLISIVIPYRSDSFCIPHIPQLYLYKMENCLDKTCKHENQFQSEKCPYISPHRATLYKMENIGKHWIPVDVWSLLASSTLSWSAEGRLFNLLAKHRLPGDLDWLGNTGHILAILGQSMPLYIRHYMPLIFIHWYPLSFHIILIHSVSLTFPNYPSIKWKTNENIWTLLENIGKHWIPVDVWSLLASSTLSWSADGRLFNLLAKHRLPGDLDWLGNTGHILAILGHYWAVNATIYMPLYATHIHSLISIVIPYPSDSFCIPHIPQLSLYKMENCLDKTCKHENQFRSEKCPYISPHRAALYKMENYWKTLDPSGCVEPLEQHPQLER